jgi:hypothetical protein
VAAWRCDCETSKKSKHGKLVPTEVDEEERCIKCGYFAVAGSKYEVYARGPGIGGYAPLACYQTLLKNKKLSREDVYNAKGIPEWIDIGTGDMKKGYHKDGYGTNRRKTCNIN